MNARAASMYIISGKTSFLIMPIDKDEWEKGRTSPTLEFRILDFLRSNPDKAFICREIADALFGPITELDVGIVTAHFLGLWRISDGLKRLTDDGQVSAREIEEGIRTETYFIAVQEVI